MKRFEYYKEQLVVAFAADDMDVVDQVIEDIYYEGENHAFTKSQGEDSGMADFDDWREED
jgi:tetrahydromethanopterin S-methyltransferase subunit F